MEIGRASCRERGFAVVLIAAPTGAVGVATGGRIGVAWLMTLVSPGSLHAVAVRGLRHTPYFGDWRSYVCASVRVNGFEVAVPVPPPELTTALVLVKIAALPHVASFGP